MAAFATSELERVAVRIRLRQDRRSLRGLGYGKFSARQVLQKCAPGHGAAKNPPAPPWNPPAPCRPPTAEQALRHDDGVIKVHGIDDLLVYRAKCCNPIRGDAIVGYVTRGKGIAVHSRSCPNVQNLMYEFERKIDVEWARNADETFPVQLVVHTDDRPGLLHQITTVLSDEKTNIRSLEARDR